MLRGAGHTGTRADLWTRTRPLIARPLQPRPRSLASPAYGGVTSGTVEDFSAVPVASGGVLSLLLSELGTAMHIREKFGSA